MVARRGSQGWSKLFPMVLVTCACLKAESPGAVDVEGLKMHGGRHPIPEPPHSCHTRTRTLTHTHSRIEEGLKTAKFDFDTSEGDLCPMALSFPRQWECHRCHCSVSPPSWSPILTWTFQSSCSSVLVASWIVISYHLGDLRKFTYPSVSHFLPV